VQTTPAKLEQNSPAFTDCWNRIGVTGDASCPELETYAHCRNCPVYAAAATRLLDRDLTAADISEWAGHFARPVADHEGDMKPLLIFRIGEEWLALPVLVGKEVAELRPVHSLPHQRKDIVLGLVNIRGELVVCLALGKVLGLAASTSPVPGGASADRRRLIVLRSTTRPLAFPVDEVADTYHCRARELRPVPATVAKAAANHTRAIVTWRDRNVGYLDGDLLVQTLGRSLG